MKFENLDPKKDCVIDIDLVRDRVPLTIIVGLIIVGMFAANILFPEFSQYGYCEIMSGTATFSINP